MKTTIETKYEQSRVIADFILRLIPEKMIEDMKREITQRICIAAIHKIVTGNDTKVVANLLFEKTVDGESEFVDGFCVEYTEDVAEFVDQNDMGDVLKELSPMIMASIAKRVDFEQNRPRSLGDFLKDIMGSEPDDDESEAETQPANDEQKPSEQVAS